MKALPTSISQPWSKRLPTNWQRAKQTAKKCWNQLVDIGNVPTLSHWEQKRVRLLNGIASFSLILFPLYMLGLISSPDYVTFWLCFVIFLLNTLVLLLNYFRLHTVAAWYFLLSGTLFYTFNTIAKKNDGTEYTLIVYSVMGLLFFWNYWLICLYFVLNVAAFFWVRYAVTVIPPFLYIPEMSDVHDQNMLISILGLFAVVYYVKSENVRQEAQLEQQNNQLQYSLQQLHATQAQLIQREKLASLGELTAGVAHEIQNPLNFVNNFADLSTELLTELDDERAKGPDRDDRLETALMTDLRQNLQSIHRHGYRAAAIVRGMLEHSNASTGERELIDLNSLCTEYLHLVFNSQAAKGQSIPACFRTDLDPALRPVHLVGQDLGRVLSNLFSNAFYAVWQRHQHEPDYQPDVWVRTRQLPTGAEIRIGDNGPGIDPAIQSKIFQPFFTTKPTGVGTGLGLSLSHDIIVKGYGGTLMVQSELGRFSEFVIVIPMD